MAETRGRGNRECVAQGTANLACGFLSAMGGCAMIGQSMINIQSGGRGRASGITAALALMAFVLVGSQWIEIIPVAALVGVMFMVVIGTFAWSSFNAMFKVPRSDAFVIVSALVFAWKHAKVIHVVTEIDARGSKVYSLRGPLFFGSVANFRELFHAKDDPDDVIIDFQHARVSDHSAIEAIDSLAERYLALGKQLHLRHLSPECRSLLKKAGNLVEVNVIEDPVYHVATDELA